MLVSVGLTWILGFFCLVSNWFRAGLAAEVRAGCLSQRAGVIYVGRAGCRRVADRTAAKGLTDPVFGSWVLGLGSWVLGLGSWVLGLGSGVWGLGSGVWGLGSGGLGLGSGVPGRRPTLTGLDPRRREAWGVRRGAGMPAVGQA